MIDILTIFLIFFSSLSLTAMAFHGLPRSRSRWILMHFLWLRKSFFFVFPFSWTSGYFFFSPDVMDISLPLPFIYLLKYFQTRSPGARWIEKFRRGARVHSLPSIYRDLARERQGLVVRDGSWVSHVTRVNSHFHFVHYAHARSMKQNKK